VAVRRMRRGTLANESSALSVDDVVRTSRNDMVLDRGFAGIITPPTVPLLFRAAPKHRGLEMGLDSGVESCEEAATFSFPWPRSMVVSMVVAVVCEPPRRRGERDEGW